MDAPGRRLECIFLADDLALQFGQVDWDDATGYGEAKDPFFPEPRGEGGIKRLSPVNRRLPAEKTFPTGQYLLLYGCRRRRW